MSIRVIARVRPQQKHEHNCDVILSSQTGPGAHTIKIPNPKNEKELFSFAFNSVYESTASQEALFSSEILPTIKHLFSGFDVTIFAYGSTGTGKTHTMRGGKSLADRGVIPRFLSSVFRRARKITNDSGEQTRVQLMLSYYEIYNDKVYDLLEPPERRTVAGLALREHNGKTIIVGLTERPCDTLKAFEHLYDEANVNRSTSATKLNASSSRSHAILRLKLLVTTDDVVRVSTASCIDLAGSEDNRRTGNGRERMVESASINKSLFTLAKCAEAISNGDSRIPYRESKMTRILSLGQNQGLTIMILNLAPVRPYHLDSLSSLNFANRTKQIEVREIENEPVVKGPPRILPCSGSTIHRQPLRPLHTTNLNLGTQKSLDGKQSKSFAVYSDRHAPTHGLRPGRVASTPRTNSSPPHKRQSNSSDVASQPKAKRRCLPMSSHQAPMSKQAIEDMIERKVTDILTARAMEQVPSLPQKEVSAEVQQRLEMLEKRIENKDEGREQGLEFLFMAKQHAVRGENASALRMYTLARQFFPQNEKLEHRIARLQSKLGHGDADTPKQSPDPPVTIDTAANPGTAGQSFKVQQLLDIINGGELEQIQRLRGVGIKKAEMIHGALHVAETGERIVLNNLSDLKGVKGVGSKAVENMLLGL